MPVNFDVLYPFLQGYEMGLLEFLDIGFKNGFSLCYTHPTKYRFGPNLKSVTENPTVLMQKMNKEVELGRIVGHFTTMPYKNLQISPLGLVPKKERVEYRLIHHLSYPLGSSINDGISDINKTVQYETLDIAIFYINKLGQGYCWQNLI